MSIFHNEMFNERDDKPIFLITVKDDNTMFVEPVPAYVKPVVPQAVADWFDVHQDDLELSIRNTCNQMNQPRKDSDTLSEFELWFKEDSNKPIETLIKMKTGYDIKSLPTYLVTFKENGILGYFSHFALEGSLVPVGETYISHKTARFTDKEKALALATLIDGNVEEKEDGIKSIKQVYCLSKSQDSLTDTSTWTETPPVAMIGYVIWSKTIITYYSGLTTETTPFIAGGSRRKEHDITIGALDNNPGWIQNKFFNSRELKRSKSKFNTDTFF